MWTQSSTKFRFQFCLAPEVKVFKQIFICLIQLTVSSLICTVRRLSTLENMTLDIFGEKHDPFLDFRNTDLIQHFFLRIPITESPTLH